VAWVFWGSRGFLRVFRGPQWVKGPANTCQIVVRVFSFYFPHPKNPPDFDGGLFGLLRFC